MECINLILSNRCQAACVWCPSTRGTSQKADMPFDLVKKIIDEASSPDFPYTIKSIRLSENGEAIINRQFFEIAEYIKSRMPHSRIDMLTNFLSLDSAKSKRIIEQGLIDALTVNIDGHDRASYESVKRINYNTVMQNLQDFNELHLAYDSTIELLVNAMPAWEYDHTVREVLKTKPLNSLQEVPYSDPQLIANSLAFLESNPKARFKHSSPGLWAERKQIANGTAQQPVPNSELDCPELKRLRTEIFISPRGDWYPCCQDDNQDIVLGNLKENSLVELWNSKRHTDMIAMLEQRRFDEIGYPCNTVMACQTVKLNQVPGPTSMKRQFLNNLGDE